MIRTSVLIACLSLASIAGCHKGRGSAPDSPKNVPNGPLDPQRLQSAIMSFADRYMIAMAETYEQARATAATPEARISAQRFKLLAGMGALGNAVDTNPVVGLMDMVLMVDLTLHIAQEPWAAQTFGPESAAAIVVVLEKQNADIRALAALYLSPAQLTELRDLADRWLQRHPEQRYIAGARLTDFPEASQSGTSNAGGAQLASGVFNLIRLDPFTGLDPAVREVAESRILAERMFFYLQHMPAMLSWQTDLLYTQMLTQPEMVRLFENTTTVAGSTTQFTQATSRFSDATTQVADSVERFRLQLPDQQAKLVAELNALVAQQRDGALQQATTQVSSQRDAAIKQLGDTVTTQQDLMTKNLQGVTDQSIDRLYKRARSLVLITTASILIAFLIYRKLAKPRANPRANP